MSDLNLTARSPLCQSPGDPADARGCYSLALILWATLRRCFRVLPSILKAGKC